MADIRAIRRRIRSITATQKTTNAMQLVAASKMRRAQARALAARPYAERLQMVLADLAEETTSRDAQEEALHPLLAVRPQRQATVIVITPSRGLCGGLPSNLNRTAAAFMVEHAANASVIAVGKKGRDFFLRTRARVAAEFVELPDYPSLAETLPISRLAIDDYASGRTDAVFVVYSQFVNTLTQRPVVRQLLPVSTAGEAAEQPSSSYRVQYIFEPSPAEVLNELLPRYVEMQLYNAILENAASEQSARMVAMRNATDAARDLVASLTLALNKARQEQITKELLDLVGGAAAVTGE
jgi:F-type H+-transporting ATPase subunit gamma